MKTNLKTDLNKSKNKRWIISYLSLGSNMGNRQKNLIQAERFLRQKRKIRIKKSSSIYQTSPIGPKQRKFLNSVIKIETLLSPHRLLFHLKSLEKKMGRKKETHWGPRRIDLDLIFYGDQKVFSRFLKIPHPEFHKRKFVLQPLKEIAPNLKPIGFSKTVSELLSELTDPKQKVRLVNKIEETKEKRS